MKNFNEILMPEVRKKAIEQGIIDNPHRKSKIQRDKVERAPYYLEDDLNNLLHKKEYYSVYFNKPMHNNNFRIVRWNSTGEYVCGAADKFIHDELICEFWLRGKNITKNEYMNWYLYPNDMPFLCLHSNNNKIYLSESYKNIESLDYKADEISRWAMKIFHQEYIIGEQWDRY